MPVATTPRETSTTWMEIPGIGPLTPFNRQSCRLCLAAGTADKHAAREKATPA
jgi:hypothetical protein